MGKMKDTTIPDFDPNSHYPECPMNSGCLCPWMAVCEDECGCLCEVLTALEKRLLKDAVDVVEEQVEGDPIGDGGNWNSALSCAVEAIEALRKK